MGMGRPHTEAERQHKREMSKRFWASPEAVALKEARGKRLGEWNKTRFRPEAERKASGERLTKLNKTRERSEEERRIIADRVRNRMVSGWKRKPLTDEEKEMHRERMFGNTLSVGQKMSDTMRERHRQRMLTKNPGLSVSLEKYRKGTGPNKAEQRLDNLISSLGFRFVGDAMFWLPPGPSGKRRNPDWVFGDGSTKIAVLHHGDYWHRFRVDEDTKALKDYEHFGWKVLVIMEKENKRTKYNPELTAKVRDWLASVLPEVSQ